MWNSAQSNTIHSLLEMRIILACSTLPEAAVNTSSSQTNGHAVTQPRTRKPRPAIELSSTSERTDTGLRLIGAESANSVFAFFVRPLQEINPPLFVHSLDQRVVSKGAVQSMGDKMVPRSFSSCGMRSVETPVPNEFTSVEVRCLNTQTLCCSQCVVQKIWNRVKLYV